MLGSTALAILDDSSPGRARSCLRASRAVAHLIIELDVGISRDRNLIGGDGKVLVGTARQTWSAARIHRALNNFATETSLGNRISLSKARRAGETTKRVAIKRAEAANVQARPIESALLFGGTLIVAIRWS